MNLSNHEKHSIRKWFHQRGENVLDLVETAPQSNCEICAPENANWWEAHGFSPEEREAICALICPQNQERADGG